MATLSRTKKYQDLRNRLQHDTNADALSTNDLSRFQKRLNEIDSQNFSYTENASSDSHNAEHARNLNTQQQTQQPLRRHKQTQDKDPFANVSFSANENNDVTFDNDYLDQYIREVKQYNIDQGNAASENTSLNILKQIERNNSATPKKPYPSSNSHTADIPFLSSQSSSSNRSYQDVKQPSSQEDTQPTQAMSKEDIMQEVQNLVNGTSSSYTQPQPEDPSSPFVNDYESKNDSFMSTDTFNRRLEADRTTRQQLLNETTQMRAQLDDYEDNLSEVSDKMRQTNRILNIVLVILIFALAMIVGVVIYWIITSK